MINDDDLSEVRLSLSPSEPAGPIPLEGYIEVQEVSLRLGQSVQDAKIYRFVDSRSAPSLEDDSESLLDWVCVDGELVAARNQLSLGRGFVSWRLPRLPIMHAGRLWALFSAPLKKAFRLALNAPRRDSACKAVDR
jgi:hypothetical protein